MKDFLREILDMEENLWKRRMKVLYQYQRVQEIRRKIAELEKMFEEELGIDFKTVSDFVDVYEEKPEEVMKLKDIFGEEVIEVIQMLAHRVKQIREMKKEVDDVEREVFEVDSEIDEAFEKLQEYKRKIQGML